MSKPIKLCDRIEIVEGGFIVHGLYCGGYDFMRETHVCFSWNDVLRLLTDDGLPSHIKEKRGIDEYDTYFKD